MNTNKKRKYSNVTHLIRLLDEPDNQNTEFVRYLGRLARTGDPNAAQVIAALLHVRGEVGRSAARSLVRLARSSSECLEVVVQICDGLIRTSRDSEEIHNAGHVWEVLARPLAMRSAA
jgi:hypothetical protein